MANIDEFYLRDVAHEKDLLSTPAGDLQSVDGEVNIRNAIFRRLITQKGSLVHRPNYGVGLKSFLNAPNSFENQRKLASRIKEQLELDFRIEAVQGVQVEVPNDAPEKITLSLRIRLAGLDEDVNVRFKNIQEAVN